VITAPFEYVRASSPDEIRTAARILDGFHSLVILPADSIVPLSAARAIGVRTATAPYVFIAETHAYPDPDTAAKLVERLSREWSLVVPGFRNANPRNGISWAGFLSDYGAWSRALPAGETLRAPAHDTAFRRSVLTEFGDRLEQALSFGDELYLGMRARGLPNFRPRLFSREGHRTRHRAPRRAPARPAKRGTSSPRPPPRL